MSVHAEKAKVVVLNYDDLKNGVDLTSRIEEAYGFDGIGLLTVENVPTLVEKRSKYYCDSACICRVYYYCVLMYE